MIQREYLEKFKIENNQTDSSLLVQLDVSGKLTNGSFMDWLLRSEINYRIENNENKRILNIYLDGEFQRNFVMKKANQLLITTLN